MIVTDHESPAKCEVESLQHPDGSNGSHYQANDAAHDSHEDIECMEQLFPPPAVAGQFEISELNRVSHGDAPVVPDKRPRHGNRLLIHVRLMSRLIKFPKNTDFPRLQDAKTLHIFADLFGAAPNYPIESVEF